MTNRITAVLVTYNSRDEIGAALNAFHELHASGELDCVVVDNASHDRTAEKIRQDHPWVTVIESPINLGYGRGLNLGLSRAATPYVLFMNPDAVIATADTNRLRRFLDEHPAVGMVAPAIVEGDGELQHAGAAPTPWRILASAGGWRWVKPEDPIVRGGAPFRTDWLCGALLLARTDLMKEIQGFDPRFFLYFEETDLCFRVLQKKYELWAIGEAEAFHIGSTSAKKTGETLFASCIAEHYFKSRFYYLCKYYGRPVATVTEIVELGLLFMRSLLNRVRGRSDTSGLSARMTGPFLSLPKPVERTHDTGTIAAGGVGR